MLITEGTCSEIIDMNTVGVDSGETMDYIITANYKQPVDIKPDSCLSVIGATHLNIPLFTAICLRTGTERPKGLDEVCFNEQV